MPTAADAKTDPTSAGGLGALVGSVVAQSWIFPPTARGWSWGSPFGNRAGGFHPGIDFPAPEGTPVLAPQAGRYTRSDGGGYGNSVLVTTPAGFWRFAHFSRHAPITDGATVPAGAVIGYVGTTGNSTGNHLHVEWHPSGGAPVDPSGILRALEAGGAAPITTSALGDAAGSAQLAGIGPDLSGLAAFFGALSDPKVWRRIMLVSAGAGLVVAGFVIVKRDAILGGATKLAVTAKAPQAARAIKAIR
jgi:hypothetical protein